MGRGCLDFAGCSGHAHGAYSTGYHDHSALQDAPLEAGQHYQVQETDFLPPPPPVQQPRIPIWVVGAWLRPKSMQRAMRYDGLLPAIMAEDGKVRISPAMPDEIRMIKTFMDANRAETTPYDIVIEGETPGEDLGRAWGVVQPYAEVGATWWIEAMWTAPDLEAVLARIQQGPPFEST